MKKLLAAALLAFAVPAFAHAADEAKPADKSAKKAGKEEKKGEAKPEEKKAPAAKQAAPIPSGATEERLRGAAARTAQNMEASLAVPTATSVRAIPAKLLIDNRIVINNHLSRGRGGKISFTHLIGYAIVRALESMPEMNHSYAEVDGKPAGTLTLSAHPAPYVAPADEPERYVHLLVTDRAFRGLGVGSALLAHAVAETRREGVGLLRVDCYAGDDQRLVAYYRSQGFTPTETFTVGEWPGQVLAQRVTP